MTAVGISCGPGLRYGFTCRSARSSALGHANLGVTSIYLQGIDTGEII